MLRVSSEVGGFWWRLIVGESGGVREEVMGMIIGFGWVGKLGVCIFKFTLQPSLLPLSQNIKTF